MTIAEILAPFEKWAPLSLQESYDNAGLITGDPKTNCTGVLLCLDVTENIVLEAIKQGYNLIIAHHPLIFSGLKKINPNHWANRALIAAIRSDIAIYACHTNADNILNGVNDRIADKLQLINRRILLPKTGLIRKLVVYVPLKDEERLRDALFEAGAGSIGLYKECSFSVHGMGTFLAQAGTNPHIGSVGKRHTEPEARLEVIVPKMLENSVLSAMKANHPYEEVAYELYPLENEWQEVGAGLIGELPEPIEESEWLDLVKLNFKTPMLRHTHFLGRKIQKVALCGGAGSFLIQTAIRQNADAYLTADVKYHEFFEANHQVLLTDIGHFESEQFTIDLFADILRQNFPTFAHLKTNISTNPVHYH
jgi:dinuclear metal center YbgI/SA1388 family protein